MGDDRRKATGGLKIKLRHSRQNPKVRRRGTSHHKETRGEFLKWKRLRKRRTHNNSLQWGRRKITQSLGSLHPQINGKPLKSGRESDTVRCALWESKRLSQNPVERWWYYTTCIIVYTNSCGLNFGRKNSVLGGKRNLEANLLGVNKRTK